ncbi:MAG TPA: glycosyltransferase family 4 protein [Elusimicrobiota bacterium]|nr:glycosyltransferase family 4 protein [Elusimicrobiota bacterium]
MPRIGIALRNFSLLTGVSRCVAELARRLPEQGYEPFLLTRRLPKESVGDLAVETVPWLPLSSWFRAASFDWFARRRLAARGVSLVHGHGDLTRQDVLSVHNCDAAAAHYVPDGRRPAAGVEYVRKRQFTDEGSRVIVANSDMVRRDLSEFYGVRPEKIRRVYLGVDLQRFHPDLRVSARAGLLKRARWPEETAVVVSVMSGDPAKRNFGLLSRAVSLLAERRPAALCVVGNADWKTDDSARRLHEKGRLLAVPATLRVQDYFAAADVFMLPAFYEEFGLTVLEALASGCPCAVSRRCGAAELISHGENGFVFDDVRNPEEAVHALEEALSPKRERVLCRRSVERYSWDNHAREIVELYRGLL